MAGLGVGAPLGITLGGFFFGWPLWDIVVALVILHPLMAALLDRIVVLKAGLAPDRVILRRLFTARVITRDAVSRVVIDPPVSDVKEKLNVSTKTRLLSIRMREGRLFETTLVSPGLQLRIARVLDPDRYPGDYLDGLVPVAPEP